MNRRELLGAAAGSVVAASSLAVEKPRQLPPPLSHVAASGTWTTIPQWFHTDLCSFRISDIAYVCRSVTKDALVFHAELRLSCGSSYSLTQGEYARLCDLIERPLPDSTEVPPVCLLEHPMT